MAVSSRGVTSRDIQDNYQMPKTSQQVLFRELNVVPRIAKRKAQAYFQISRVTQTKRIEKVSG